MGPLLVVLLIAPSAYGDSPRCEGETHATQAAIRATLDTHPATPSYRLRAAQAEARSHVLREQSEPLMLGVELEWMPSSHWLPGPLVRVSQRLPSNPQREAGAQRSLAERDRATAERQAVEAELEAEVRRWLLAREQALRLTEALQEEEIALTAMRRTLEGLVGVQRVDGTALFAAELLQNRLDDRRERAAAAWREAVAMLRAYTGDANLARACLEETDPLLELRAPSIPASLEHHPSLRARQAAGRVAIAEAEALLQTRRNPLTWMAGTGLRPTMDSGLAPMVMVGLEGMIPTRPRTVDDLAAAEAVGDEIADAEARAIRWELERIVDQAQARWSAAAATHRRTEDVEIPFLTVTLEARIARLSLGQATAADVLETHQALTEARTRAIQARFEALEAQRLVDWLHATTASEVIP